MTFLAWFDPGPRALWPLLAVVAQVTTVILVAAVIARTALARRAAVRHGLWICALALTIVGPAAALVLESTGVGWHVIPWGARAPKAAPAAHEWGSEERDTIALAEPEGTSPAKAFPDRAPPTDRNPSASAVGTVRGPADSWLSEPGVVSRQDMPGAERTNGPPRAVTARMADPVARDRRPPVGGLLMVWAIGACIGLARLVVGWRGVGTLRRSFRPFDARGCSVILEEVRAALGGFALPPLVTSSSVDGPMAIGVWRPVVVLPEGLAASLAPQALRDVLVHECAHVRRRDTGVGVLQRLVAALYWPHPLVHHMNAELARAREEVCDNFVLRLGDPCGYARTLLELTERGRPGAWAGAGVALGGARWTLQERIAGLLDPRRDAMTEPNRRAAGVAAVALVLLTLGIVAVRPARPLAAQATPARAPAAPPERIVRGTVVDEGGQPVAGATVRPVREEMAREAARTAADGGFTLAIGGIMFMENTLPASAGDGSLLGLGKHVEPENAGAAPPVRIVLKPSQAVTVRVRDKAGDPVVGAAVEAVGFDYHGAATTGAGGEALLRVPADAKVRWVIGLKPGAGFDYFENYQARPVFDDDLGPLPADVTLTLDGARTVRIKAVDSGGRPVPGAEFLPWLVGKPGKVDQANTSCATIVRGRADERGVATWDWLPAETDQDVSFLAWVGRYSCPESPVARRGGPAELEARLLRGTVIRGVVRQADGRPAPGVLLRAEGRGATPYYCRMQARTAQDGSYAIEVYPEQSYVIAVLDDRQAAPSLTGVLMREGQPRAGLDLMLADGTLIHGRATKSADGTPAADETITLVESGRKLPEGYARYPEGDTENLVQWAKTDAAGRYRLRVGPGRYTLFAPGHAAREELLVQAEAKIERDFQVAESARRRTLAGVAVAVTPAGERPIAGAVVEASAAGRPGAGNRAVADGKGRFELRVNSGKGLVLYVYDRAGTRAGFTALKAGAADVRAAASPASRIRGRVVDKRQQPQIGRQVQLRLDSGPDYQESGHFFTHAVTDAHGVYEFPAVVVGAYAEVSVPYSADPRALGKVALHRLDVRSPEVLEAPDLVVPAQGDKPAAERPHAAPAVVPASRPVAPTRSQIEELVRAIGRDAPTPSLVDRAWLLTRPQFAWAVDLERVRQLVGDPEFTRRVDEASRAVLGHPADTLTLLKRALSYHVGSDVQTMKYLLGPRTMWDSQRLPEVHGTVVDADTDRPIGGAIVYASDAMARTDAAGAFVLKSSTPQRRGMIWVEADGYALAEYPAGDRAGDPADVRVRLVKEAPVVGRVVGADGRSLTGAIVSARLKHFDFRVPRPDPAPTGDSYGFPLEVRTDADGRFALRGLPPGLALSWYEVRHPEHQTYRGEPLEAGESITLALGPGCKVSGTVVDEQGRPIGGALVSVRTPGRRGDVFTTHTIVDGRFRFGGISPGRWVVVVQPERHAPAIGTVVASQDHPVENQYVVGPGSYISGRALGPGGEPMAGAAVGWAQPVDEQGRAAEDLALDRMTNTADDGTFRLGPLAQGEYRLTSVADEPRRLGRTNARSNQRDAIIRLEADSRPQAR